MSSEPTIPIDEGGLPMMPAQPPVLLAEPPPEAASALDRALRQPASGQALRAVASAWPALIDAWARLGEWAYSQNNDVEAFAFFRTAYHRGLDQLRRAGWRGMGYIPWSHVPNRGILRAFRGLMLASAALGEIEEAERCRELLLDSDPSDPFDVGMLRLEDFNARLPLTPERRTE